MKNKIGSVLMILSVLFLIGETIYFGCNFLPASNAEFTCDLIGAIGFIIGMIIKK